MRIKKYTGCCIYKNRNLPISEFVANAKAPIEHLFNNHQWCHADWCWAKGLDNKTHKLISTAATPATVVARPPPATTVGGDGVPLPSTTEVVSPAVLLCQPCNDTKTATTAASPSPHPLLLLLVGMGLQCHPPPRSLIPLMIQLLMGMGSQCYPPPRSLMILTRNLTSLIMKVIAMTSC